MKNFSPLLTIIHLINASMKRLEEIKEIIREINSTKIYLKKF